MSIIKIIKSILSKHNIALRLRTYPILQSEVHYLQVLVLLKPILRSLKYLLFRPQLILTRIYLTLQVLLLGVRTPLLQYEKRTGNTWFILRYARDICENLQLVVVGHQRADSCLMGDFFGNLKFMVEGTNFLPSLNTIFCFLGCNDVSVSSANTII